MALTLLGKSASAIWAEAAPADTSFMWMRILDSGNPDIVIPHHFRNGAWRQFSSTDWLSSVISVLSVPPGAPTVGQRYIVGPAATGAWVGQENKIATRLTASWDFYSPEFGSTIPVVSEQKLYSYYGTWFISSGGSTWGDITGDINNQADLVAALLDVYNDSKSYTDSVVTGLWNDRGNYDASTNLFPATGGSGGGGAIKKGDIWTIAVAGTLGGELVEPGDTVRAIIDGPAQITANWAIQQNNIGYVAENTANKAVNFSVVDNIKYPSTQAVVENFFRKTGNAFGAVATLGLTDDFDLTVQTGNANLKFRVNAVDRVTVNGTLFKVIGVQNLFANAGADIVTASTRMDVRGVENGNIFRLASHSNTTFLTVVNNTGAMSHTANINSGLNFNGTWSASANNQTHAIFSGDFTSRNVSAEQMSGYSFTPMLRVNAGNPISQIIIAVDLLPTWANFGSGNVGFALRVGGGSGSGGSIITTSHIRTGGNLTFNLSGAQINTFGPTQGIAIIPGSEASIVISQGANWAVASTNNNMLTVSATAAYASGTQTPTLVKITPSFSTTGGTTTFVGIEYAIGTNSSQVGLTHIAARFAHGRIMIGGAVVPTAKLQLRGDGTTTGELLRLEDSAASNKVLILDNGTSTFNSTGSIIAKFSNPGVSNAFVEISSLVTGGFRLLQTGGYGITIAPGGSEINTPGIALSLRSQADQSFTLSIGGQDINPTTSRTFVTLQPVAHTSTLFAPTTGNTILYRWTNIGNAIFSPSSGTANFTYMQLSPTVATSGTYNTGTIVGLDYAPTISGPGFTHYAARFQTGRVLIGTTAGTAKFQVRGDGTTTGELFKLESSTPTTRFLVLDNGTTTITGSSGTSTLTINATAAAGLVITGSVNTTAIVLGGGAHRAINGTYSGSTSTAAGIFHSEINQTLGGNIYSHTWFIAPNSITTAGTKLLNFYQIKPGDNTTPTHGGSYGFAVFQNTAVPNIITGYEWTTLFGNTLSQVIRMRLYGNKLAVGADITPTATLHVRGEDSTSANYAARFENLVGDLIARFRNDLVLELGGTSAILEVNAGIPSGNAAIRFLSNQALSFRFQDTSLNDYLNFKSTTADKAVIIRQPVEYDFGQGEKTIKRQFTITTTAVNSAQNVVIEWTLTDGEHYLIRVIKSDATATDGSSISSLGDDIADVRKVAATNIEGGTPGPLIATQNRIGAADGGFNWNLDTVNQKIQYRFQNSSSGARTFVIWIEYELVKRITPV